MLESWTSMYQQGQISKTYVNENHKSQKDGYVWSDTIYVKYYSTILRIFFLLIKVKKYLKDLSGRMSFKLKNGYLWEKGKRTSWGGGQGDWDNQFYVST